MRHTGQCTDHGDGSKGPSEPLSTHDGSCVGGRQDSRKAEQTALKNGSEGWGGTEETEPGRLTICTLETVIVALQTNKQTFVLRSSATLMDATGLNLKELQKS